MQTGQMEGDTGIVRLWLTSRLGHTVALMTLFALPGFAQDADVRQDS